MRSGYRSPQRYGGGPSRDEADAEFVGLVNYVGPEPTYVSGAVPAVQTLEVKVQEATRGAVAVDDVIEVDVVVVGGEPHITVGQAGLPALDPSMVQAGVLVRAYANDAEGRWQAFEISTDGPSSAPSENYAGRRRYSR
jgi:hypothetical protein